MSDAEAYQRLMAQLAQLQVTLEAEQAQARAWYEQQRRAAQAAVDRATRAVEQAQADVDAARSTVESTDLDAHRLWRLLEDRVGELGPPPPPAATADPQDDPVQRLRSVEERLDRTVGAPRALPSWASPLLVVAGAAGAGVGYAAAHGARWAALEAGGDLAVFAPVLKQIITLLAPLVGLVPARLLADRRHARLDGGAVGVVLVVGLMTVGALLLIFGR